MSSRSSSLSIIGVSIALLTVTGCPSGPDIDLARFEPLADEEDLPLADIRPERSVAYVALHGTCAPTEPTTAIASHGTSCAGATDLATCEQALETAIPTSGFQPTFPDDCFKYVAYTRGDEVGVVADEVSMRAFLGTIDSRAEGLFLAASLDYHWSAGDRARGAIREADGGAFDLIVTKVTRYCDPIVTTGYLLRISATGEAEELETWTVETLEGCV